MNKLLLLLAFIGFSQAWAGNKLPQKLTFTAEGVSKQVEVVAKAEVAIELGAPVSSGPGTLEAIAQQFLSLQTGGGEPYYFTPNLTIYKVKPKKSGEKVWIGNNSSMGQRSAKAILASLEKQLSWPKAEDCGSFVTDYKLVSSVARELVADKSVNKIVAAAENLSALYRKMRKEGLSYGMNEPLYSRGCSLDSFTHISFSAWFVDTTPMSAPETEFYMIVYTDGFVE